MASVTQFDRDRLAQSYADHYWGMDDAIGGIYYLPKNAEERELRFVMINQLLFDRFDDALETVDFGVDRGMDSQHLLRILDVTEGQWKKIFNGELALPDDWTIENYVEFPHRRRPK